MNWVGLPFTLAAAALSWWAFARKGQALVWRVLILLLVVLSSLALLKNLADILWLGHEPLL